MNAEDFLIRPVQSGDIIIRDFNKGVYKLEIIEGNNIIHHSFSNLLDLFKFISTYHMWSPGGKFSQQDEDINLTNWSTCSPNT